MYTLRCYHIESTVHRKVAKNICNALASVMNIEYNISASYKNDEERSAIMAKGNMTIRMEPELKAQAAALFKSLGMDLSTATGIFYRQALRCHGLPFEVKVDEPNAVTYAAMEAAEKGEDMYGPFDSVADLMEALNA